MLTDVQPWSTDDNFVIQSIHSTLSYMYNDTLHLAIEDYNKKDVYYNEEEDKLSNTNSILHAFSHSQDYIKDNFAYGTY